ncbi:hypothetical protein NL676_038135 [Syzygium grande]|nr:hypothetical protein NL676_038135 [Syzygium grande]
MEKLTSLLQERRLRRTSEGVRFQLKFFFSFGAEGEKKKKKERRPKEARGEDEEDKRIGFLGTMSTAGWDDAGRSCGSFGLGLGGIDSGAVAAVRPCPARFRHFTISLLLPSLPPWMPGEFQA